MTDLILASGSAIRAKLLNNTGIPFTVETSGVDEDVLKREARASGLALRDLAMALAEAKAKSVAARHPEALVLGADQLLVVDDRAYDKPATMEEAAARLALLSGRSHTLFSAACICRGGETLWQTICYPRLLMEELSERRIAAYLAAVGPAVLSSVGAYHLEGHGARLFSEIEGDYFSILGLPLMPLLSFLRKRGVLEY